MAVKKSALHLLSSLNFRILAPVLPVIGLMIALGGAVFSLGLGTVSHYANERITEDLERTSREIYNITDERLQRLLLDDSADSNLAEIVSKGNAICEIEEYAMLQDLQIIVYEEVESNILLQQTEAPVDTILEHVRGKGSPL